jgi:hypothetical protein
MPTASLNGREIDNTLWMSKGCCNGRPAIGPNDVQGIVFATESGEGYIAGIL